MSAQVVPFPALARPPVLSLAACNPHLDAERAAFAAETVADIRVTLGNDVLPMLRMSHQAMQVMRHALSQIDQRHPLVRALLTEAEAQHEVIEALARIADPTGDHPDTPPGAA